MPRPPRADEAGAIYHALNRGNARQTIFHKTGDYEAFEKVIAEGLKKTPSRSACLSMDAQSLAYGTFTQIEWSDVSLHLLVDNDSHSAIPRSLPHRR